MTKISNQYSLTNILTADLANSRLGINNVSPTVALDVTGAGKFSSSATALKYIANSQATYASLTYEETFKYASSPAGIWFGNSFNSNNNVALQLRTSNDGTSVQALTITPTGNVGIGTTSPSWLLEAYKDSSTSSFGTYPAISVNNPNVSGFSAIYLFKAATQKAGIEYNNAADRLDISAVSDMRFITGAAERMRITSTGQVAIGRSNPEPGVKLLVADAGGIGMEFSPNANVPNENRLLSYDRVAFTTIPMNYSAASHKFLGGNVHIETANGLRLYTEGNGAYWMLRTYNAVSNQLRFNYQGSDLASIATSTGNYTALSDVNKKKDFEQSQIGLNEVLRLKPTLYRMKTEVDTEDKHLGFIAQEVKEFIPQAYSETGEGDDKFIGLTEMPIIAALVKAVQELSAKVSLLENK